MRTIICDTTPLILLAKLNLLALFCSHSNISVPFEVAQEATARNDLADAVEIQKLIAAKKIHLKKAQPQQAARFYKDWGLGKGESAALALALSEKTMVVTDDFAAMRVARAMQLAFTTTPMILVQMCRQGLLSKPFAQAKLTELQKHAWIDPKILNQVKNILEGGL